MLRPSIISISVVSLRANHDTICVAWAMQLTLQSLQHPPWVTLCLGSSVWMSGPVPVRQCLRQGRLDRQDVKHLSAYLNCRGVDGKSSVDFSGVTGCAHRCACRCWAHGVTWHATMPGSGVLILGSPECRGRGCDSVEHNGCVRRYACRCWARGMAPTSRRSGTRTAPTFGACWCPFRA